MRSTERANNEIRQIEILRNYTKHAEGISFDKVRRYTCYL
jgi:ribonuclease PH